MRFSNEYGCFEIDSLPSQVQVAICHGFYVHEHKRGQGHAFTLHCLQIKELLNLGYNYAICTVSGINPAQSKSVLKAGWKLSQTFYNTRISQKTEVWTINLTNLTQHQRQYFQKKSSHAEKSEQA